MSYYVPFLYYNKYCLNCIILSFPQYRIINMYHCDINFKGKVKMNELCAQLYAWYVLYRTTLIDFTVYYYFFLTDNTRVTNKTEFPRYNINKRIWTKIYANIEIQSYFQILCRSMVDNSFMIIFYMNIKSCRSLLSLLQPKSVTIEVFFFNNGWECIPL